MGKQNVYVRAREVVRELRPLLDYIEAQRATHLDERLDEVCAITWSLGQPA